jgi:hypothetical protein
VVNHRAIINTAHTNQCWRCCTTICIHCGSNNHGTDSCAQHHEKALQAVAHDRDSFVMCPKCRGVISRTAGCDHMTCNYPGT